MSSSEATATLATALAQAAPSSVAGVEICGHRFSPTERTIALPDGSKLRFAADSSGSNDIYDSYYRIAHASGTLEVYSGDHDVADYTEIRFNGRQVLYELNGPGTEREENNPDPDAPRWADAVLEAAGLATGRSSFSSFCYEVFRAPGPTCARIYDQTGPTSDRASLADDDGPPPPATFDPLRPGLRVVEPVGSASLALRGGEVTCGQSGGVHNEVDRGGTWLSYRDATLSHDYHDSDHSSSESVSFDGATVWSRRDSVANDGSEQTDPAAADRAVAWLNGLLHDANEAEGPRGLRRLCSRLHIPDGVANEYARVYALAENPTGPTSKLAIAALVLGALSVLSCGLLSPVGLVVSILALRKTRRLASTGLILSIAGAGLMALGVGSLVSSSDRVETRVRMERVIDEIERRRKASEGRSPEADAGPAMVGDRRDVWETPLVYRKTGERTYEVRSAGPDRRLDTEDDITATHPLSSD